MPASGAEWSTKEEQPKERLKRNLKRIVRMIGMEIKNAYFNKRDERMMRTARLGTCKPNDWVAWLTEWLTQRERKNKKKNEKNE